MLDSELRQLERDAPTDAAALDRYLAEMERTGGYPFNTRAMASFDEETWREKARRSRNAARGKFQTGQEPELARARVLFARFAWKHRIQAKSGSTVACPYRLSGNRRSCMRFMMRRMSRDCWCVLLEEAWNLDHQSVWLRDGNVVAIVSQPYSSEDFQPEAFAEYGIKAVDYGQDASWYFPGSSHLIVLTRAEGRGGGPT